MRAARTYIVLSVVGNTYAELVDAANDQLKLLFGEERPVTLQYADIEYTEEGPKSFKAKFDIEYGG